MNRDSHTISPSLREARVLRGEGRALNPPSTSLRPQTGHPSRKKGEINVTPTTDPTTWLTR